jgi:hypothetical protein
MSANIGPLGGKEFARNGETKIRKAAKYFSGRWGQTGNKNLVELSLSKSGDTDFLNIQDRGREFDIGRIFLKS